MVPTPGLTGAPTGPRSIILTGPTAAGKTALALEMAALDPRIEIVNGDSLLFYRGMDIGTAKPTREELALVPHHILDIREPNEPFTAGDFCRLVQSTLTEIHARGHRALVVGGTGFYLKALLFGLWEGPGTDPDLREELEARSPAELYGELHAQDPVSALRIGANDRYRLVRALEVLRLSGKTPTQLEAEVPAVADPRFALWICERETEDLHVRIARRVRQMLDQGFVAEVEKLQKNFPGARPLGAVGYKEVARYLEHRPPPGRKVRAGEEGLIDEIELATRQLVKKQRTWFKNLSARAGARTILLPDGEWQAAFREVYL
jgi:tRNA dimethylallyltransferase